MILKVLYSQKNNKHYYKFGITGFLKKVRFTNWVFISKEEYVRLINNFVVDKRIEKGNITTYFLSSHFVYEKRENE